MAVNDKKEDADLEAMAQRHMDIISPIFGDTNKRLFAVKTLRESDIVGPGVVTSGVAAYLLANSLAFKALVDNRGYPNRHTLVNSIRESLPVLEATVERYKEILGALDRGPKPAPAFDYSDDAPQVKPGSGGPVNL